jgi:uncharacterized protein (DUF2252 family)
MVRALGERSMPARSLLSVAFVLFALGPAGAQTRTDDLLQGLDALPAPARQAKLDALTESPFRFFRGTADLFWADMADDPRLLRFGGARETEAWLVGDAHPENVGTFGEVELVYDLNDFDEAVVGDFQLDVWRMAAGIELMARANGLSRSGRRAASRGFAEAYSEALTAFAGTDQEHDADRPERALRGRLAALLAKVRRKRTRARMLSKWTTHDASGARVLDLDQDKLAGVDPASTYALAQAVERYAARLQGFGWGHFTVKSVARRLGAGTGSLGSARFYVLVEGPTFNDDDDVILDVKEQSDPAPWAHLSADARARLGGVFDHPAARVAAAERALLGARADRSTGWLLLRGTAFSVRPRSPFKDDLDLEDLNARSHVEQAAAAWGRILATAHARADESGLVPHSFDDAADARLRYRRAGFADLVWLVACEVADRTEEDHAALRARLASGGR